VMARDRLPHKASCPKAAGVEEEGYPAVSG
jgi:hypothetical protein